MFSPRDREQLDSIARESHRDDGLGCGNLELVGAYPLLTESSYTPPEFFESIKLTDVKSLLDHPKAANIQSSVQKMQDLGTRFHTHEKAAQAPTLVKTLMTEAANGKISGFSAEEFEHKTISITEQNSVIGKIVGTDPTLGTIIIGAHLDSINRADNDDAPGADDDASGIATIVEVIRSISASGATFKRTIEFHGYAAEEVGLVGSRDIAGQYQAAKKKVDAMLQLDMVSWSKDPENTTIYLITNDTSSILRRSLKDLLNTYLEGGYEEVSLSAGTSDHKAWNSAGFHAVFPFEHPVDHNKSLHTTLDRVDVINNFALAERFTKLVLAFVSHHAGLVSSADEFATLTSAVEDPSDDINIAVVAGDNEFAWFLAASTPLDVKRVETCETNELASIICESNLKNLPFVDEKEGRNFFINPEDVMFSISAGDFRIFHGYDANDNLTFRRTVKLTKK